MILNLTDQQAQSIMQLADAAVRGGGLQFARQAVAVMDLMDAAAAASAAQSATTTQEDPSDA
jgi:hypothetical protein